MSLCQQTNCATLPQWKSVVQTLANRPKGRFAWTNHFNFQVTQPSSTVSPLYQQRQLCHNPCTRPRRQVSSKNVSYIDLHRPNTSCSLAWLVAGRKMLGGGKLMVLYRQSVDRGCLFSYTGPASCLADLQLLVGSCRLGEQHMFMFDWCLYHPPEGHPRQLAYTFVICFQNFNILCLLLHQVPISVVSRQRGRLKFKYLNNISDKFLLKMCSGHQLWFPMFVLKTHIKGTVSRDGFGF